MAHITREDGEHFVIPSYRDVLSAKRSTLKREILFLSSNYGEYIALQKKGGDQYEIAFSSELGYLLGESFWYYFKRPRDFIYCEPVPNTTDVILVIVKSGSVYLDGSFPADSIPEELIVFQTQKNEFEIFIYGDVPISEAHEEGKFTFDPTSVKSFTVLKEPVFQRLPTLKIFQLQPVDTILRQYGIGALPIKPILALIIFAALIWMGWSYMVAHKKELPPSLMVYVNPYQAYINAISTPDPSVELKVFSEKISSLFSLPGWAPTRISYSDGILMVGVRSLGAKAQDLFAWADQNGAAVKVTDQGFNLVMALLLQKRQQQEEIFRLDEVIGEVVDRISTVYPGNVVKVSDFFNKGIYSQAQIIINVADVTPATVALIAQQLASLPVVLSKITLDVINMGLTGNIVIFALGN